MVASVLRALLSLALLVGLGCAAAQGGFEAEERSQQQDGDLGDPSASAGAYDLDDKLCWQSIQPEAGQSPDEAHAACMRQKGWSP